VLVSKYADHLPLYCQAEIYVSEAVDLDRSTLADWVGSASKLLGPLVDHVRQHVFAATKIHADDTLVPVLSPGMGKIKTGRLWTYVRDDRPAAETTPPGVWFAYTPHRKGEHPRGHLTNYIYRLPRLALANQRPGISRGEIYLTVALLFVAQATNTHLSLGN
jgi:hypothetical protein